MASDIQPLSEAEEARLRSECLAWLNNDGEDGPVEQAFGEGALAAWLHLGRKIADLLRNIIRWFTIVRLAWQCLRAGHRPHPVTGHLNCEHYKAFAALYGAEG